MFPFRNESLWKHILQRIFWCGIAYTLKDTWKTLWQQLESLGTQNIALWELAVGYYLKSVFLNKHLVFSFESKITLIKVYLGKLPCVSKGFFSQFSSFFSFFYPMATSFVLSYIDTVNWLVYEYYMMGLRTCLCAAGAVKASRVPLLLHSAAISGSLQKLGSST